MRLGEMPVMAQQIRAQGTGAKVVHKHSWLPQASRMTSKGVILRMTASPPPLGPNERDPSLTIYNLPLVVLVLPIMQKCVIRRAQLIQVLGCVLASSGPKPHASRHGSSCLCAYKLFVSRLAARRCVNRHGYGLWARHACCS
eukprot:scaffold254907_cov31-Tisochrysis_lutea.AAC.1